MTYYDVIVYYTIYQQAGQRWKPDERQDAMGELGAEGGPRGVRLSARSDVWVSTSFVQ